MAQYIYHSNDGAEVYLTTDCPSFWQEALSLAREGYKVKWKGDPPPMDIPTARNYHMGYERRLWKTFPITQKELKALVKQARGDAYRFY